MELLGKSAFEPSTRNFTWAFLLHRGPVYTLPSGFPVPKAASPASMKSHPLPTPWPPPSLCVLKEQSDLEWGTGATYFPSTLVGSRSSQGSLQQLCPVTTSVGKNLNQKIQRLMRSAAVSAAPSNRCENQQRHSCFSLLFYFYLSFSSSSLPLIKHLLLLLIIIIIICVSA